MRSSPSFQLHNQRGFQNIKKQTNINKAIIHEYQYKITTRGRTRQAAVAKLHFHSASATLAMGLLALGLLVPFAKAQTVVTMTDTNFIMSAAQGGMTEVKLGELASTNGKREDVKEFGRMMVKDHTAINYD